LWGTVPIGDGVLHFRGLRHRGTVNSVNLTDGVDGLAAGTSFPVFVAY
jgi:hypothetical protein